MVNKSIILLKILNMGINGNMFNFIRDFLSNCTFQVRVGYSLSVVKSSENGIPKQGRNEVRWRPGHEASLAPPCSNLRSFGSKCTVLKKVDCDIVGTFRRLPQSFGALSNDLVPP